LVSQLETTETHEPLPQIVADRLPLESADGDENADDSVSTGTTVAGLTPRGTVDFAEIGVLRDEIEMTDFSPGDEDDIEDMVPVTLGTAAYHDNDYFFGAFSLPYHPFTSLSSCPVLDDEAVDEDQSQVLGSETPFEYGGKISYLVCCIYSNIHAYAQSEHNHSLISTGTGRMQGS
jgi:hypothetical protein